MQGDTNFYFKITQTLYYTHKIVAHVVGMLLYKKKSILKKKWRFYSHAREILTKRLAFIFNILKFHKLKHTQKKIFTKFFFYLITLENTHNIYL